MPRQAQELKDVAIRNLKVQPGQTRPLLYAVGGPRDNRAKGLYIQITPNGAKSWLFRYTVPGTGGRGEPPQKRREMGLGSYPDRLSLLQARARVIDLHKQLAQGIDPIGAKIAVRRAIAEKERRSVSFRTATELWLDNMAEQWKSPKDYPLNKNRFERYVFPKIGDMQMADVKTHDIVETLKPIWIEKADTATKLRGYVSNVFGYAIANSMITTADPTPTKKHMNAAAGDASRINGEDTHQPALPRERIAEFMNHLRRIEGIEARALEFSILNASRAAPVYNATWAEFRDFEKQKAWIIPGEKMKGRKGRGRDHRVPLSADVIDLLRALPRGFDTDQVFPIGRDDMTLLIRRMNTAAKADGRAPYVDPRELDDTGAPRIVTQHGTARSTFSDWAAECTAYPSEVREMALAHKIKNVVEAAYRRGDLYEKRAALMDDWATYCGIPPQPRSQNSTTFRFALTAGDPVR